MPGISRFFGIVIYMYANDHGPVKHFHAEYNGHWAKYSFDGDLIKGGLPRKQERLVLAWAEIHREDLESNWKCVEAHVRNPDTSSRLGKEVYSCVTVLFW